LFQTESDCLSTFKLNKQERVDCNSMWMANRFSMNTTNSYLAQWNHVNKWLFYLRTKSLSYVFDDLTWLVYISHVFESCLSQTGMIMWSISIKIWLQYRLMNNERIYRADKIKQQYDQFHSSKCANTHVWAVSDENIFLVKSLGWFNISQSMFTISLE
jgi:hypothetical protein